jgi:hypothetical protein
VAIAIRAADSSATGVSIYDVSARKPGFIAVAAVYTRINRGPVALMLYFDWDGSLQRKVVLDKLSQIESLEIDSAGHVWTLNAFDRETPAESVFTEFDRAGSVIKDLVKPRRHWSTNEGTLKGGQTSFGLTSGRAWAWLPESRTLILIDEGNGRATIHQTGLPHIEQSSGVYARQAAFLPNGQLLMDVGWRAQNSHKAGWFVWSFRSGWKSIPGPADNRYDYLYAADQNEVIFASGSGLPGSSMAFRSERIGTLLANTARH